MRRPYVCIIEQHLPPAAFAWLSKRPKRFSIMYQSENVFCRSVIMQQKLCVAEDCTHCIHLFTLYWPNACLIIIISRAHSFPRQNLTNSAAILVNSAAHRGKADEIPRLTANTQLNFRGGIKS